MQQQNRSSSQFSQRTEVLARKIGVLLKDLPDQVGISERMFYGYRSGKYPITDKAWRKLEAAERDAGITQNQSQSLGNIADLEEKAAAGETLTAREQMLIERMKLEFKPMWSDLVDAFKKMPSMAEVENLARAAGRWPLNEEDNWKPLGILFQELQQSLPNPGEKS